MASTATSRGGEPMLATFGDPVDLDVSPQEVHIGIKQAYPLTVTEKDDSGNTRAALDVTWSSSDEKIATVDEKGWATGVGEGSVQIRALKQVSEKELFDESTLTVSADTLESIDITPNLPTISAGGKLQFKAMAKYSDHKSRDVTRGVAWTSDSFGVANISSSGMVIAVKPGTSIITAASGEVKKTVLLTVTAAPAEVENVSVSSKRSFVGAGQTRQFTAVATYTDDTSQDITADPNTAWSSSKTHVASIAATGLATAAAAGSTMITATYRTATGTTIHSSAPLTVELNFNDMGDADTQAFMNAKSRVNQLLTAFERRGNLSDAETAQLQDALELVTEYLNNNPDTPIPNFNAASKAGNAVSDLQLLGITFNADPSKGPIGTGSRKANVIDDRFRAIADYLYNTPPPIPGLEHDPGTFPPANGPNPGGLSDEQLRVAAIYGYVKNSLASPPPYRTIPSLVTSDDYNRRNNFNQTVEAADAAFRTNRALYVASLTRLIHTSQTPQINVSDWAKVVDVLVKQGIPAKNPQIHTWIDRALATAQNVGQDAQPSEIDINLPDLEQDVSNFEIISGNIFALQPAYFCSMLEELKVFQVVEKLVELFQNGILPVVRGDASNLLFAWWKNAALRVSESERRAFYARSLGFPGGDADSPNREFKDLFMRFVSAVSSFVRQNTVDNLLRSNIPGAISQQQVRKSARDLATNISSHGYGIAYPMATELQKEINDVMAILKNNEVQDAYGAKDMWQLVDQVAGLELGGAKNSVKYRTMAAAGATVFAWLAQHARVLASNSYVPILDVALLQNVPSYSTKPTTNPSDFDLVGACDQWLAVTGTQEDSVEQAAQPVEAPVMPSRPIQIPSVARDMLESVGVPAMAYSQGKGQPNGAAYANWRNK